MNQLKAGAFLNYVVIALNTIVGLLYTPYMLRMLGQNEYGLYSLVASIIAYLTVLDLGFGNALIRYTAKFRAENRIQEQYEMFGMFLILYVVIGLIAIVAGGCLYFNVDRLFGSTMTPKEIDHARIMMLILVFNLAFTFPMSIFGSIITAYERFVFPKVISIISISFNTLIMIILLNMGYKAIAMVVVQTLFNVATLIAYFVYSKGILKIKISFKRFNWDFLREVAIYSFWIFLNVIMDKFYWSTGQFVLGAVIGTAAVAVFAIAIQLHSMYMLLSSAISSVFLPKVTRMVALGNNYKEISDLFIRAGRFQNIIVGGVLWGFILFGKPFIILWAGEEYQESYIVTLLFFICLYVPLIQTLGITILQARNQMKFRSVVYISISVISVFLQIWFAKLFGVLGCGMAIFLAIVLGQVIIMNIYYNHVQKIQIREFWIQIMRMDIVPICLVLSMTGVFYVFNVVINSWNSLILCLIAYLTVYIPLFYKFSLNKSEKDLFLSIAVRSLKYSNLLK